MSHNITEGLLPLAVDIASLVPDGQNARKHTERNLQAIAQSLTQFGQRTPLVVRRDTNGVLKGNGTLEAAVSLGWTQIAAVYVNDDPSTATRYAVADNRTAELAEWDNEALGRLFDSLGEFDDSTIPGYNIQELQDILDSTVRFEPRTAGGGGDGGGAPGENGAAAEMPGEFISIAFSVPALKVAIIQSVLKQARADHGLASSGAALAHICEKFGDTQ